MQLLDMFSYNILFIFNLCYVAIFIARTSGAAAMPRWQTPEKACKLNGLPKPGRASTMGGAP